MSLALYKFIFLASILGQHCHRRFPKLVEDRMLSAGSWWCGTLKTYWKNAILNISQYLRYVLHFQCAVLSLKSFGEVPTLLKSISEHVSSFHIFRSENKLRTFDITRRLKKANFLCNLLCKAYNCNTLSVSVVVVSIAKQIAKKNCLIHVTLPFWSSCVRYLS